MALSRPIGWLRDQRGDAVGLATADPLFQGGETKPTGYVATYSPVFTAEQVQQEIKAARADAIARLELIRQLLNALRIDRIDTEDWPADSRIAIDALRARLENP